MRSLAAVWRRELQAIFLAPVSYVAFAVFLVLSGYFFSTYLLLTGLPTLRPYFGSMGIVLLVVAPVLTMRLFAEEMQQGTAELWLTAPISLPQVVLGKYLAVLTAWLALLGCTGLYPLLLGLLGEPDWGAMAAGYLGFFLIGAAFLAAGVFASALTDNQMVAGLIGFGLLLLLWIVGWLGESLGGGTLGEALREVSALEHFVDFQRGVVDTRHLAYYLSLVAGLLFLTVRAIERRTWA